MKTQRKQWLATGILAVTLFIVSVVSAAAVNLISKEELKLLLDNDTVVILDVRTGRDWSSSEFKVKGALRAVPGDFDRWSSTYPKDKKLVLYCA